MQIPPHPVSTPFHDEQQKMLSEAAPKHYAYIQFLTGLCGIMLALLAPLENASSDPNQFPERTRLFALLGLTISLIAGAVALYGDKNAYAHRWKLMERIYKKHDGNLILTMPEVNTLGQIQPPAFHRWAFHTQWLFALAGVLLLLLSKASPLFLPSTNIPAESAKAKAPANKPASPNASPEATEEPQK